MIKRNYSIFTKNTIKKSKGKLLKKLLALMALPLFITSCGDNENIPDVKTLDEKRPNILLIVADDMGYSDIGAFGGEIATPNLDQLAAGGLKMSNFYAASACSPTRSMLLGGVGSHLAGMGTMYNDQAPSQLGQPGYEGYMNMDVVSVSSLLQDAGYHTYMTGKWHLGYEDDQAPNSRGFEKSYALLQGGSAHFNDDPMTVDHDTSWFREDGIRVKYPDNVFSSQFYTDKMIDYMKSGEADEKPFFAYLAYTAPHWPLQAPDDYRDKYKGKYDEGYGALSKKRLKSMEEIGLIKSGLSAPKPVYPETENWENISDEQKKIDVREMEIYAAMVDNMDFHIGRVLEYLEVSGQRDNTIIIFMSDNGAAGFGPGMASAFPKEWIDSNFDNSYDNMGKKGSYIYYGPHWAQATTAPSRLFKGFSSEGGIKVPGIINFKGKLVPELGAFNDQFMTVLDLAPTFLDLANTEHPGARYKGRDVHPYIGKSIMPYLTGEQQRVHSDNDTVSWELNRRIAVRKGDWKLIKIPGAFGTGEWELFNIKHDPGESNDLSSVEQAKLSELVSEWEVYVKENGVIMVE